jgi:hypothetical protein
MSQPGARWTNFGEIRCLVLVPPEREEFGPKFRFHGAIRTRSDATPDSLPEEVGIIFSVLPFSGLDRADSKLYILLR